MQKPDFEKRGGLAVVVLQDANTKEILTVAYTNKECYLEMLRTGDVVLFSTSRNERWKKGETSGNIMRIAKIPRIDCDGDAIICQVVSQGEGNACHTGKRSCFYRTVIGSVLDTSNCTLEIIEVCETVASLGYF